VVMNEDELNEIKEWLETQGYEFEDDSIWMEDCVSEHRWKDVIELIYNYHKHHCIE